jgi:hypothetical protein
MLPYSTGRLIQEPDNNLGKQHLHPGSFAYYPPILGDNLKCNPSLGIKYD